MQRLEPLAPVPWRCQRIDSAKFLRQVGAGDAVTANLSLNDSGQGTIEFYVAAALVARVKLTTADAHGDPSRA
jgi:3-hydroxymyristoyl/3-hydroxydecanoyl-(acyl carrier protein) dehydratase